MIKCAGAVHRLLPAARTSTRPRNIQLPSTPFLSPSFRPLPLPPTLLLHFIPPQFVLPSLTAPWYAHPYSQLISTVPTVHSHVSRTLKGQILSYPGQLLSELQPIVLLLM